MKAYTCGARAIFVEPPEKCPLLKDGNCEDGTPCDAAEVEVLSAVEYEAMEAVVEAAGKVEAVCYEGIPANFIKDLASTAQELRVALTRLRALGKG